MGLLKSVSRFLIVFTVAVLKHPLDCVHTESDAAAKEMCDDCAVVVEDLT